MAKKVNNNGKYEWSYSSFGGVVRVNVRTGEDIAHLHELDQKLWTVLSCPVHGLEFDEQTLRMIDTDGDGKIRVGEVVAAADWLTTVIKDKDLFLNLTIAKGRGKDAAVLETHIEMIDIQIPLSCEETFGFTPLEDLPEKEYNAEKDCTLYGDLKAQSYITLSPGMMAIFFPEDGHAPCIADQPEIKNAIFKVKVKK